MTAGQLFILIGVVLILVGLILTFAPGLFGWFGRLPGDIRIGGEHRSFFFPITSMIVVSLIVTLILNLFFRR